MKRVIYLTTAVIRPSSVGPDGLRPPKRAGDESGRRRGGPQHGAADAGL